MKDKEVKNIIRKADRLLNILYVVIICGIVLGITILVKEWGILTFIKSILKVMAPLFIGFVFAWLLDPLVCYLQKIGIKKRGIAALIVFFAFFSLLFLFFSFLIPTLYDQLNDLISAFPNILKGLQDLIQDGFRSMRGLDIINIKDVQNSMFAQIEKWLVAFTTSLPNILLKSIGGLFTKLGTIIIGLMVGLYMLIDFDSIVAHAYKLLPRRIKKEALNLINKVVIELRKYVKGVFFQATLILITCSIGFAIIGLKAPLLFGVLCGVTDLIPYIGPYIGGAAAAVVGFSQSPITGILTLLIVFIVQSLESMVLQPLLMSKTMRLHPVTIILALLIFGHFFGVIGMILATPILALIKIIYEFLADKYNWFSKDY